MFTRTPAAVGGRHSKATPAQATGSPLPRAGLPRRQRRLDRERGWIVRALWEAPRMQKPERDHYFKEGTCTKCGDPQDGAGPDCVPLAKAVDPRATLPFAPRWLLEPLRWLRDARPGGLNRYDREYRARPARTPTRRWPSGAASTGRPALRGLRPRRKSPTTWSSSTSAWPNPPPSAPAPWPKQAANDRRGSTVPRPVGAVPARETPPAGYR